MLVYTIQYSIVCLVPVRSTQQLCSCCTLAESLGSSRIVSGDAQCRICGFHRHNGVDFDVRASTPLLQQGSSLEVRTVCKDSSSQCARLQYPCPVSSGLLPPRLLNLHSLLSPLKSMHSRKYPVGQ